MMTGMLAMAQQVYELDMPVKEKTIYSGHLKLGGSNPSGERIEVNSYYMSVGGKPVIPVMGEFHYSRYPECQWEEEILKMKAGGVTVIPTYVFWSIHEEKEGVFEEFKGTGNMELVLDRKLAEKRIFPAIDIAKSSTRRDDLLLSPEEQEVVYALHKILSGNKAEDMLEDVLKLFVRTKNNKEFIYYVKKSLLRK
jgi:hypothetical protein